MTFPTLVSERQTYCGLERELLIFLAGGLPADSVFLEKYLNIAHYIGDVFLSQTTCHMWVTAYGENSSYDFINDNLP